MNKIEKMNCVIAREIMRWQEMEMSNNKVFIIHNSGQPFHLYNQLKFHNDYSWLMKAVEQIERRAFCVCIDGDYYMGRRNTVTINGVGKFNKAKQLGDFACEIKCGKDTKYRTAPEWEKYSKKTGITPKMETLYEAVYQFAKYYNVRQYNKK